jgi:hypothetical protein
VAEREAKRDTKQTKPVQPVEVEKCFEKKLQWREERVEKKKLVRRKRESK